MIFFERTPDDFKNRRIFANNLLQTNFILKKFANNLTKTKNKSSFLSEKKEKVTQNYIEKSKRPVKKFFELSSSFYQERVNRILNDSEVPGFYCLDTYEKEEFINNLYSLIANIPVMFFSKIEKAITKFFFPIDPILAQVGINEYVNSDELFKKRTEKICNITDTHVKFLAENQSHRLKSAVEKSIYKQSGFYQYSWHNQRDIYVVGNPQGLYPIGTIVHEDHWLREGKIFRWDMPPPDGHPGWAPGCRCFSRTIKRS